MKVLVNNCEELHFLIYLVGYPEKGESQVILVLDSSTGTVLMSGVVDCYEYKQVNRTIEILNQHQIDKLNFFCWTHTDDDHSVGFYSIIQNFCDKNTQFFLPEGVYGTKEDFVDYSEDIKKALDKIKTFNTGRTYNVSSISIPSGSSLNLDKLTRTYKDIKDKTIKFQVTALAPNGSIIRRRMQTGLSTKNDSSIALMVKFGNYSAFLSGDIEDSTISQIDAYHFEELNYLKTPHHTSQTSTKILKKFEEVFDNHKIDHACSTVYKVHSLPNVALIENYKLHAKAFFSTGLDTLGHKYGTITIEYKEASQNLAQIRLEGNSKQLF